MLVTRNNFEECFKQLLADAKKEKFLGFDTETTTLFWWKSPHYADQPRVFSMQFSTATQDYYFDFGCRESLLGNFATDPEPLDEEHFERFRELFALPELTWFIQNAKFDMHHVLNHGLTIAGTVHCTQATARLVNNEEKDCSLDGLSKTYLGAEKIDLSEYFGKDSGRVTQVKKPGDNGKFYDFLHFDRLPLDILVKYGERDTRLVYQLGQWQLGKIAELNQKYFGTVPSSFGGSLYKVLENERQLTKTLFDMERRGVLLDMPFVKEAHKAAIQGIKDALAVLDPQAQAYVDAFNATKPKEPLQVMDWQSHIHLKGLFDQLGLPYTFTEEENASFTKDNLEKLEHPLAKTLLEYRRHSKRAHTYLENYLWLADMEGVLHCNFAQGGPRTGRMSCREPNLQNVPKRADKKEADFVLRKCFIPRPGHIFADLDYDQVEYRLMLDYAREMALIERVIKDGLNVHEATQAELSLADYDSAKTMNFMLLYGGGVPKLAMALYPVTISMEALKAIYMLWKWPTWRRPEFNDDKKLRDSLPPGELVRNLEYLQKAQGQLDAYFTKLPAVQNFIKNVKDKAKKEGVIFTWLGRVLQYGKDAKGGHTNYKAPNGLIQGGAGDISKVATNLCGARLKGTDSALVLHVHDALLVELAIKDISIVGDLTKIMEHSYPHRLIPLTVGAAWSEKSWGDLKDGVP